jgi:hypothetical protein
MRQTILGWMLQKAEMTEWTRLERIVMGQRDKYSYIQQLDLGFSRKQTV